MKNVVSKCNLALLPIGFQGNMNYLSEEEVQGLVIYLQFIIFECPGSKNILYAMSMS